VSKKKALSCPLCQKPLSERSQEEKWRIAQGEIVAAYSKHFPQTKGIDGVWRGERHGDWVLVRGERERARTMVFTHTNSNKIAIVNA
jgi:hypothetical protein